MHTTTTSEPTGPHSPHQSGPSLPGRRRVRIAAVAGLLLIGLAAGCSDEDDDGGTIDEEVTELEQDAERTATTVADATGSAVTEVEQQVEEGAEEPEDE